MILAALTAVCGIQTSCDDHESIDSGIHVGDIVFSDLTTMSYERYVLDSFTQVSRTPIAVVFAEGNSRHKPLAVLLDNVDGSKVQYADSLGSSLGVSTALDSCCGRTNTIAMQETGLSPAANSVFRIRGWISAFIPSVAEMRLLVSAQHVINPIIRDLGGDIIDSGADCWYWTSTEVEGNTGQQAWICSAASGDIQPTAKDGSYRCRAVIEINR